MSDQDTRNDDTKAMFTNLVMMLASSAMQQLGAAPNPMTGKTEVDLQGAQFSIDVLDMLRSKTSGNLDPEESRMLSDVLSSLQMNYVQASRKRSEPEKENPEAEPHTAAEPGSATPDTDKEATLEKPSGEKGNHEPRFHKSYG